MPRSPSHGALPLQNNYLFLILANELLPCQAFCIRSISSEGPKPVLYPLKKQGYAAAGAAGSSERSRAEGEKNQD